MRVLVAFLALLGLAQAEQSTTFGLEFTTTEVLCSAALPNGTAVGLTKVDGGEEYRAVMYRMFMESKAHGVEIEIEEERERRFASFWGWDWTWSPLPSATATSWPSSNDAVKVLSRVVAQAKRERISTLSKEHGIDISEKVPKVTIASPTCLHTHTWPELRLAGIRSYELVAWLNKQDNILLRAVEDGGFRLGAEDYMIIAAELIPDAFTIYRGRERYVIAEFHAEGIRIRIQGKESAWNVSPQKNWQEGLKLWLPRLMRDAFGTDQKNITLVPAGGCWTKRRLKTLERVKEEIPLNIRIRKIEQPEYTASLGAAKLGAPRNFTDERRMTDSEKRDTRMLRLLESPEKHYARLGEALKEM